MAFKPWSEIEGSPSTDSYSEGRPAGGFPQTEAASDLLQKVRNGEKLTPEQAEKEKRRYLRNLRQDEANDRRDMTPSNVGEDRVGERDTNEDTSTEDPRDDEKVDGFQVVAPADHVIVERNASRKFEQEGYADIPAQSKIVEAENDHWLGSDAAVEDIPDKESSLEENFENIKPNKQLSKVDFESNERKFNTRVDIQRIRNHRQKDWLKSNGGENLIQDIWNNTSFVEVMVRSFGETQVVLHAAARNGEKKGQELRLDVKDFFAMFSIPDIDDGDSQFQPKKFRLNHPKDLERIKDFFDKVSLRGKRVGNKEDKTLPIIKITPWEPREATSTQKKLGTGQPVGFTNENFSSIASGTPLWQDTDQAGTAHDESRYPQRHGDEKPRPKDVNQRDIWKGIRRGW